MGKSFAIIAPAWLGLGKLAHMLLHYLITAEANTQFKLQTSFISLPYAWLPPSFQCVLYVKIGKMDFKKPVMKRKLTALVRISDDDGGTTNAKRELQLIEKLSGKQIANFYCKLSETSGNLSFYHLYLHKVICMCYIILLTS